MNRIFLVLFIIQVSVSSCGDDTSVAVKRNTNNALSINEDQSYILVPGENWGLMGYAFDSDSYLIIDEEKVSPSYFADNNIEFTIPLTTEPGEKTLKLFSDNLDLTDPTVKLDDDLKPYMEIAATVVDRNLPRISNLASSEICDTIAYIDDEGSILQGTKSCGGSGDLSFTDDEKDLIAASLLEGVKVGDIEGELKYCTSAGQDGCVATETYKTMDLANAGEASTIDSSNFTSVIGVAANFEFWDAAGTRHTFTGDADFTATNIVVGKEILGTTGTAAAEAHSDCTGANQQGCVATATYITMDLTGSGVDTGLTAANFNTTIATAGNFEFWDASGQRVSVAGDSDLTAANIISTKVIFGVTGTATVESHSDCSSDGETGCIATNTYKAADTGAYTGAVIRTGTTIAGVAGSLADCSANSEDDCFVNSSTGFDAADFSNLIAGNIKRGVSVAGVTGDFPSSTSPLPRYSDNGTTTGTTGSDITDLTSYGTQAVSNASFEFWDSTGRRYAASGDADITAANIISGVQFENLSLTGTAAAEAHVDCSSDGETGCVATNTYIAADTGAYTGAVIRTGTTIGGVAGSLADCSANSEDDCFVNSSSSYDAADLSNLIAGNVKRGISVAGVTGNFPSSTSPLPRYSDSGSTTGTTGTDESDLTAFGTQIVNNSAFEFWDSTGKRYTANGDADIAASNVISGVQFENLFLTGTATGESHVDCTSDGEVGCISTSTYKAADTGAYTGAVIRTGTTIAGVAGSLADCSANSEDDCFVNSSTSYDAADLSNLTAGNVKRGISVAGVTGNFPSSTSPLPRYSDDGSTTGTSGSDITDLTVYSTQAVSNSSFEFWDSAGKRYTASGDADIVAANIITGVQFENLSLTGTADGEAHSDCTGDGQTGCVATSTYKSADTGAYTGAVIRTGTTIGGVAGTLADCSANSEDDCFVNSSTSYDAADLSNLTAANVKRGVSLAGVTGNFPSSTSPLPRYSDNGTTTGTSGSDETDLTTFSTQLVDNATFEFWDSTGKRYTATGDADIVATNIISGVQFENLSLTGTADGEAHSDCTGDGQTGCVATSTYKSADTGAYTGAVIRTGTTIGGVAGSLADCSANSEDDCFVNSSTSYDAADLSNLSAGNVKRGISLAGVTGNFPSSTSPLPRYSDNGSSTSTTGSDETDLTSFDSQSVSDSAFEFWDSTGQRYSATGDSDIIAANVLNGVQFENLSITGTATEESHTNCSADGATGCIATSTYKAADTGAYSGAVIRSGTTIGGVAGTIADCSANSEDDCFVNSSSSYDAADLSNLSAGNVKRGVSLAGVTGNFPSSSSPLPRYSDTGSSTGTTGSNETDLTLFVTQLTTDGTFEFWDSSGKRYTGSGDSDIVAANVASGVQFENLSVTGTITVTSDCSSDGEVGCITTSTYKSVDTSSIQDLDIRVGKTVGGIAGTHKYNCRNNGNTSIFDDDSDGNVDWNDTLDDRNLSDAFATTLVSGYGWSSDTTCDYSVWEDVTSDGSCNSSSDDCIMEDTLTGMQWTESNPSSGAGPGTTNVNWYGATSLCSGLSYGGYTDWRLPTQKELMQAYVHGLGNMAWVYGLTSRPGGDTRISNDKFMDEFYDGFWSATTVNHSTGSAYQMSPRGAITDLGKTSTRPVICIRG